MERQDRHEREGGSNPFQTYMNTASNLHPVEGMAITEARRSRGFAAGAEDVLPGRPAPLAPSRKEAGFLRLAYLECPEARWSCLARFCHCEKPPRVFLPLTPAGTHKKRHRIRDARVFRRARHRVGPSASAVPARTRTWPPVHSCGPRA